MKINPHDYIRLFGFHGSLPLIFAYEFVEDAGKLGYLAFGEKHFWASYMRKDAAEKAGEDGLAIYGNKGSYERFKKGLYSSFAELKQEMGKIANSENVTLEHISTMFELFGKYRSYYTKTEFFYTDEAFQMQDKIPAIKTNFATFEKFKLDGRDYLNKALIRHDSFLSVVLKKLSGQFDVPYDELKTYTITELKNLFTGKRVDPGIIESRSCYLIYMTDQGIQLVTGDEAKGIFAKLRSTDRSETITGTIANSGKVIARARVFKVDPEAYDKVQSSVAAMQEGEVLIAETTEPSIILACQKASAIVTNQGGMMSHAAITAREMHIPCIVGTMNATEVIRTGDLVEVDAENGVVRIVR